MAIAGPMPAWGNRGGSFAGPASMPGGARAPGPYTADELAQKLAAMQNLIHPAGAGAVPPGVHGMQFGMGQHSPLQLATGQGTNSGIPVHPITGQPMNWLNQMPPNRFPRVRDMILQILGGNAPAA